MIKRKLLEESNTLNEIWAGKDNTKVLIEDSPRERMIWTGKQYEIWTPYFYYLIKNIGNNTHIESVFASISKIRNLEGPYYDTLLPNIYQKRSYIYSQPCIKVQNNSIVSEINTFWASGFNYEIYPCPSPIVNYFYDYKTSKSDFSFNENKKRDPDQFFKYWESLEIPQIKKAYKDTKFTYYFDIE